MTRRCSVPDCEAGLHQMTRAGVCHRHIHRKGYCACRQCSSVEKRAMRVKTRAEMVAEGLLPREPVFPLPQGWHVV